MSEPLRKPRPAGVPVSGLSIYQPMHLGIDEDRKRVQIELMYRNILLGGEPGSGKSVALNNIVAHAAISADCGLWLMDGKQVELGLWRDIAEVFVGNDIDHALSALDALQAEMDSRYDYLAHARRRKITPDDDYRAIMLVVDEVAYFSATVGDKQQREAFAMRLRDLVARGRAAGIIVVAATQRPSADIIPTSLRDLFGYRQAFRCTTEISSDIILGYGWAKAGYSANLIAPEDRGIGYLLAEGGIPRRMKCAYLTDQHIYSLVEHARRIRRAA